MMKKLLFIISLFCGFQTILSAQNEGVFNHYHINPILINPAVAGLNDYHRLQLNSRLQYTGFEDGKPNTYAVTYNGPVGKTFGFGAMVFNENIASLSRTRIQTDFAFRYQFEKMKFSFGFATEWLQERVPSSVLDDPIYDAGDLLLEDAVNGINTFDATLGAYALINKKTFVGLTFPNLVSTRIGDTGDGLNESTGLFNYYTLMAGHRFGIEGTDFELEPSMLIRSVRNVPFQIDFNIKANFLQEKITTGLSYRSGTGGSIGLLLGTKINNLRLYYSYDVTFQRFQRYNNGSHELTVSFDFGNFTDRAEKFRK